MVKAEVEWAAAEQVQAASAYVLRVVIESRTDEGNRVWKRLAQNVIQG